MYPESSQIKGPYCQSRVFTVTCAAIPLLVFTWLAKTLAVVAFAWALCVYQIRIYKCVVTEACIITPLFLPP